MWLAEEVLTSRFMFMENKVSYDQMETVWEHGITKEEIADILGYDNFTREDFSDFGQIAHYGLIYRLYIYRGNKKKAQIYSDKIPNSFEKVFGICYLDLNP